MSTAPIDCTHCSKRAIPSSLAAATAEHASHARPASGRTKNGTSVRISCQCHRLNRISCQCHRLNRTSRQCQAMPSITLNNIDRWRSSPFRSNKMSAEVSIRRDALHMHAFCTWYHFATFVLTQLPRNFPFRPVHFLSEFGTLLLGATRNVQ